MLTRRRAAGGEVRSYRSRDCSDGHSWKVDETGLSFVRVRRWFAPGEVYLVCERCGHKAMLL